MEITYNKKKKGRLPAGPVASGMIIMVISLCLFCFVSFAASTLSAMFTVKQQSYVGSGPDGESYYQMTALDASNPMPMGTVTGIYSFDMKGQDSVDITMEYNAPGVYEYQVQQIIPSNPGDIVYDDTVYTVRVYVRWLNGVGGDLTSEVIAETPKGKPGEIFFKNNYHHNNGGSGSSSSSSGGHSSSGVGSSGTTGSSQGPGVGSQTGTVTPGTQGNQGSGNNYGGALGTGAGTGTGIGSGYGIGLAGTTSKKPAGKLPQTGQLWWPVPYMAVIGLIFILLGSMLFGIANLERKKNWLQNKKKINKIKNC